MPWPAHLATAHARTRQYAQRHRHGRSEIRTSRFGIDLVLGRPEVRVVIGNADRSGHPPVPSRPARPPSRSPGSPAQPPADPPSPAAPAPGKSPGQPGRMYRNAHSAQRLTSSRNPRPARPVRGRPWKADGAHRPSQGLDAVRYISVDTATQRPVVTHGDTPRDTEETARLAENSQLAGRFRRWWQVLGSNQRRLSRRFYRPLSLCTSQSAADQHICAGQMRFSISCASMPSPRLPRGRLG